MTPLEVTGPIARIELHGAIDRLTIMGLEVVCRRIRRDDSIRSAVLTIDSERSACNPADIIEPLDRLSRCKPLFAFVEVACGASFLAALPARCVVAHPQAIVGQVGVTIDGESVPGVSAAVDAAIEEIVEIILRYRPDAPPHVARRLLRETITSGEVLEHFDIVDFVQPLDRLLEAIGYKEQT